MKKIITLFSIFCCLCGFAQAQSSFQLTHDGSVLTNGSVIHVTETGTSMFGGLIMNSEVVITNTTTSSTNYTMVLTIVSLTTNGSYQFCFGSCTMPNQIGETTLTNTLHADAVLGDLLEYFPEENSYGTSEAKLKVYETGKESEAIEITVFFDYSDGSGIDKLDAQSALNFSSNGHILEVKYQFSSDAYRTLSCYQITGSLAKKQEISGADGYMQFDLNPGCYIMAVEENGRVISTHKVIVK